MITKETVKSGKTAYRLYGWRYSLGIRLLLIGMMAALFMVALAGPLLPETYDIEQGTVSGKTILSPVQLEDVKATEQAKEEASQKVAQVYTIMPVKSEMLISTLFNRMEQLNADADVTFDDKVNIYRRVIPEIFNQYVASLVNDHNSGQYNAALLEEMKKRIEEQKYAIAEEAYFKLPRLDNDDLLAMRSVTVNIVGKLMSDQILDAESTRAKVAELVSTSSLTRNTTRELVQELSKLSIIPNKFYDEEATKEARLTARENTPILYIDKGEPLVKKGEMITEEIYDRLDSLNLLKDKVNYWPELGLFLMVLLLAGALFAFMRQNDGFFKYNNAQLLMLFLILLLTLAAMRIFGLGLEEYPFIGYLAPIAMGTMLIATLLDAPLAFLSAILFSIFSSVIFNTEHGQMFDYDYGFVTLAAGLTAVFAINRASQRSTVLKAGIMVSLISSAAILSLHLLQDQRVVKDLLYSLSFSFAGGLLTAILVIGLMPFFEVSFGILSPMKLVELSNPNHPLLRKLLTETPGTYHHSIMVGNLSETAAEAIGANGLLCRVGSFYHDIGKTKRPNYFIENQVNGENPHDLIEPELSKSIIVAHARDGVEMLKDYKIPKPIRDIAEQHHGTTLLKYFYHKARKLAEENGEDPDVAVPEEEYRYSGPKAQSKEAAIVGIADCVEAAVRSIRKPTVEQIDFMIQKIVRSRLDDAQFNECDLTLRELDIISKTLKETILGIFHSRIEYPEDVRVKPEVKGESVG